MKRLTLALVTFAGGLAAAVHHDQDRPTLTAAAPVAAAAPGASRLSGHPSRSLRRNPLTVPHRHQQVRHGRWHRLIVTAYCATGSRNAAGRWPTVGTAAANAYPIGTLLHVRTVGTVRVEDRSAPGATDVDLYLGADPSCASRAARWGRRPLLVAEVTR